MEGDDILEDIPRIPGIPSDRFITRADARNILADPDVQQALRIIYRKAGRIYGGDKLTYEFDLTVREGLEFFEDGDVVLAPGDSPIRFVRHANLMYADEGSVENEMTTYRFNMQGEDIVKRIQFIAFPLSGLGGKKVLDENKLRLLGDYILRILTRHHVPIDSPIQFVDATVSGGTPYAMEGAIRLVTGNPSFVFRRKFNLRLSSNRISGLSRFYSGAEKLGARCLASHKDYSADPVKYEFEDAYNCNLVMLTLYAKVLEFQTVENVRDVLVQLEVDAERYSDQTLTEGEFMITQMLGGTVVGFWIDDPLMLEREYDSAGIISKVDIHDYSNESGGNLPLYSVRGWQGQQYFHEIEFIFDRVYHLTNDIVSDRMDYVKTARISEYNRSPDGFRSYSGVGMRDLASLTFFDMETQQILEITGGVYRVNRDNLVISVPPSEGIPFKKYKIPFQVIQFIAITDKVPKLEGLKTTRMTEMYKITYYNGATAILQGKDVIRGHKVVAIKIEGVTEPLVEPRTFVEDSMYRITSTNSTRPGTFIALYRGSIKPGNHKFFAEGALARAVGVPIDRNNILRLKDRDISNAELLFTYTREQANALNFLLRRTSAVYEIEYMKDGVMTRIRDTWLPRGKFVVGTFSKLKLLEPYFFYRANQDASFRDSIASASNQQVQQFVQTRSSRSNAVQWPQGSVFYQQQQTQQPFPPFQPPVQLPPQGLPPPQVAQPIQGLPSYYNYIYPGSNRSLQPLVIATVQPMTPAEIASMESRYAPLSRI